MIAARPRDRSETSTIPVPSGRGRLARPPEQLVGLAAKRRGGGIPGSGRAHHAGGLFEVLPHKLLRIRIAALNYRPADAEYEFGPGVHSPVTRVLSIDSKRLLK